MHQMDMELSGLLPAYPQNAVFHPLRFTFFIPQTVQVLSQRIEFH